MKKLLTILWVLALYGVFALIVAFLAIQMFTLIIWGMSVLTA